MDKLCAICFEQMDMLTYQDQRESTSTCFKLECEHSFHTKCIIECLQKTHSKCPHCNSYKTPEEMLTMEGTIAKLLTEASRGRQLREELNEFKTYKEELSSKIKQIKKETAEFVKKRKEELMIAEARKKLTSSMRKVNTKLAKICMEKGPMYYGAYKNTPHWRRDKLIFSKSYTIFRLRYTHINCKL